MIVKDPNKKDGNLSSGIVAVVGVLLIGYWMCNRPGTRNDNPVNFQAIAEQTVRAQVGNPESFELLSYSDPHFVAPDRTCVIEQYSYLNPEGFSRKEDKLVCMDSTGAVREVNDR